MIFSLAAYKYTHTRTLTHRYDQSSMICDASMRFLVLKRQNCESKSMDPNFYGQVSIASISLTLRCAHSFCFYLHILTTPLGHSICLIGQSNFLIRHGAPPAWNAREHSRCQPMLIIIIIVIISTNACWQSEQCLLLVTYGYNKLTRAYTIYT